MKRIKFYVIFFLIICAISTIPIYLFNKDFRNWVDINIFRKNITDENIISIDLDADKYNQVFIYNKYIAVFSNQHMTLYNKHAEKVSDFDINIGNALFDSSEKYLAIAENGGTEVFLFLDKSYLWSNKLEGEIQLIDVNRNGYVAVVTKDSTYKSILTLFNSDGIQVFRSFFADTKVVDVSISEDNKNIAIGEIDWSGAIIQSNVKILSTQNAKNDSDNAIIYTYNAESGKLLTDVKYQSKGQVLCMYDDEIDAIQNENNKQLVKLNDKYLTFMSINMNNEAVFIEEESNGIFNKRTNIKIINPKKENSIITYEITDMVKDLYAKDNVIGVNTGNEIYFLNNNGGLIKKFTTNQEITNVMFSDSIAGLIYKDKIIVIDL